ncbi:MAG: penicillin-binding protein 2 [Peptococcaceae bacterium]|nr:penicillin-binding protein 2 [Peptococcaceae bacterium]
MERKVLEKKTKILTCLLAVFFLLLLARLAYMQVIEADRYRTLATQNHQRLITVKAPRGEIVDRNGVRIVSNKPVYTVSLIYLGQQDENLVIKRLAALLEGESNFQGMTAQEIEKDIKDRIKGHQRLYEPVRVAVNVSQETVNRIEEQRLELPGVNIDIEPVRSYPYGDLLGEVLGYVREITAEQLEAHKDEGYHMGDSFGQVGLENTYESYLRGIDGARQVEVDAQGRPVRDLGIKQPVPGNSLVISIDHRLQRVAQDAVVSAIQQARYYGYAKVPAGKTISGAAVVLDVNTGEILAMASIPSYDLNIFSGSLTAAKYNELLSTGALRNHAIQSIYTPGSTFKMVTATALLENKIVDTRTSIFDPGYYKYKKDWKPGGHGTVNIVKALKESCDTYFYQFGALAGPERMGKYAAEYGFGQATGIDLPGEETGRVASKELKKKIWAGNEWESQWHEYDSMDMAIGQQETKVTAVQLANYTAAIANGGTMYRPRLAQKVIGPDGTELKVFHPEVIRKVDVSKETLDIVRQGMYEVAMGGGTASGAFWGAPYTVAAKTGTAEVGDAAKNSHALFTAFAPYEKPEVAVSVIIEYGGRGSAIGGPAARKIMDAYFDLKKGITPGADEAGQATPPSGQRTDQAVQTTPAPRQTPSAVNQNNVPDNTGQGSGGRNPNPSQPPENITTPEGGGRPEQGQGAGTGQGQTPGNSDPGSGGIVPGVGPGPPNSGDTGQRPAAGNNAMRTDIIQHDSRTNNQ